MNEFWLWFWRPFAETLGVIALLAAICALAVLWMWVADAWQRRKRRPK
jgi:hypothetical protein